VETRPSTPPGIDCFYVYPTVSQEHSANADLQIQATERGAAFAQASRFSQFCRVFAPMYRQLTVPAISGSVPITGASVQLAYSSVLDAFRDYLAHDNHRRGIVFIGHSQGSMVLLRLLQQVVDPDPTLRRLLVSAILLGGNVTVPRDRPVGGSFRNIPACHRSAETGCVIAYSSFLSEPPADALFGRAGTGIDAVPSQGSASGFKVLCVNPAAMAGGSAPLTPYFPSAAGARLGEQGPEPSVSTPWVTYPGRYRAECESTNGASWLQVNPTPSDPRPVLAQVLGPSWGLHLADVNLALGNLVTVVGNQARAYQQDHR
jgi:hypothetical protein